MSKKNDKRQKRTKRGEQWRKKKASRAARMERKRLFDERERKEAELLSRGPLTNDEQMHAILEQYGLPYDYPEAVAQEAEKIDADITPAEIARRLDMREVCTFTIDPVDAKDFDDALSIRPFPGEPELWEVGVHIADVTHYVLPGTKLEFEAAERATSVYLVDRTIPMLPERLCNGICSLRPNEEKLTYTVVFKMDNTAKVLDYQIRKGVICSNRRLTYEEAQQVIEVKDDKALCGKEILWLDALAKQLRAERYEQGAIDFEHRELRFDVDETGKPIGVHVRESKDAHKLVEEFMLLANKTVARHIGKPGRGRKVKPFVYRVHDVPNPDKLQSFGKFIKRFGYDLKTQGDKRKIQSSLNMLLQTVKGNPEENLIGMLAIRSMAKAVYTTENIGHYGLAFDFYTHFTSPIRRYPDMMVHRLLARYLDEPDSKSAKQWGTNLNDLEEMCVHSSEREQLATNAERDSIKYKQVEFMQDKLDQEFDGVITGVVEWGVFVEITENGCEGLVPVRSLQKGDYLYFDEENFCLRGRRSSVSYRLGDQLRVRVAKADLIKKQLDFELVK